MVDPNLKVYGTSNIRVADNSVMPMLVSAHTQVRMVFLMMLLIYSCVYSVDNGICRR